MDLMKNWFFAAPYLSSVGPIYFYQYQENGTLTQTNITLSSSKGRYV
jgi:hypothetical protein